MKGFTVLYFQCPHCKKQVGVTKALRSTGKKIRCRRIIRKQTKLQFRLF